MLIWAIPRYSKGVLLIPVHWQRLWPKISLTNPLQSRFSVPSIPWSLRNGQKSFKMHGYHRIELWEPTAEISNHIQDPAFSDLCYAGVTRSLITESFCVGYSPSHARNSFTLTKQSWYEGASFLRSIWSLWLAKFGIGLQSFSISKRRFEDTKHAFSAAKGGRKMLGF